VARAIGINHVALDVGSIEDALEFWRALFPELQLRAGSQTMAFIDLGDQFIALSRGISHAPDHDRHLGLVVDDLDETVQRLRAAGADLVGHHDFLDPWGNRWQLVEYGEIQFTKTDRVLQGMGLDGLEKSERALEELRAKDLAD
jgi:catechol 2,3-dioxygenase-like lactoylglutathione lyase family enzyme